MRAAMVRWAMGLVALLAALALHSTALAAEKKKPKPAPPPPPPAANPLERTFVQGEEAERLWGAECPSREPVAVGETRLLDLGATKILSEEVPVLTASVEKAGKVKVTGVGPGLTVLRLQTRRSGQQLLCLRVTGDASAGLPSPGPCALPKGTGALLVQTVEIPAGEKTLLPSPGWKRFSVDAPDLLEVAATGPDELALEGKRAGKTQLRICQGAKGPSGSDRATRVQVIDVVVAAAGP